VSTALAGALTFGTVLAMPHGANAAPGDVAAATLQWGLKQSFRSYITGGAAGHWSVDGVDDTTPFSWTDGNGTDAGVAYSGSIHFQGHENFGGIGAGNYALDLTLSNVRISRTSATTAVILLDSTSNTIAAPTEFETRTSVEFATIDLSGGTDESTSETVAFSSAPSTLTVDGAAAFAGFYSAGTALDPVSFSWPVEQAPEPSGPTIVVSKTVDVSPAGELLTVHGTGFGPDGTATNGTRPPLAGKFAGIYVAFGKFADTWKPSAGAASSTRKTGSVVWVVNPADVATVDPAGSGTAVAIEPDGSFTVQIRASRGFTGEPETGTYGIYTYPGSGATYAAFETATPISFAPASATTTVLTVSPATSLVEGATATLNARVSPLAAGTVTFADGETLVSAVAVDSTGAASTTVASLAAGTHHFSATFAPTSPLLFAGSTGSASIDVAQKVVGAGSLRWGVKQSFRDYVTGSIARGYISTTGVTSSGGVFQFAQKSGGSYTSTTGTGTSPYSGSVRFYGHDGLLDVTLASPSISVTSASRATLFVRVNGASAIPFATLDLSSGTRTTPNNTVSYSAVPATLTSQGAAVFAFNGSSFYSAGEPLDPVSFIIGSARAATAGTTTVARYMSNEPAPTAPATSGVRLTSGQNVDAIDAGDEVSVEAEGFEPGEQGILVVVYSTPTVLADDVSADAAGAVHWTGHLPEGLTGEHVLTLQGSVDRGISLTIVPVLETAALEGCPIDDATLSWGFKESFRSYISGSIANGEWTVTDGATYVTPAFGFSNGDGNVDPGGAGLINFDGAIQFTGHGGALDTTVANPRIRFADADTAYLILDVTGTTQNGAKVDQSDVEFARIDLSTASLTEEPTAMTFADAPVTLTPAGADAFGTYESGEQLDPITITFSTVASCSELAPAPNAATEEPAADAPDLSWIYWLVAAIVIAAIATLLVMMRRRASGE
jgi:hypothetical protein